MDAKQLNVTAPVLFLRDRFGGDFEVSDGEATVTASGDKLVGSNPEAVELVFVNLGANDVFLRPKSPASASAGIPLVTNGTVTLTVRDDGPLPTYDWYAIAPVGDTTVYYLRVSRFNRVSDV